MAGSMLSPTEWRQAVEMDPCPPWMRLNIFGRCVEKWWAGGPMHAVVTIAATALGMAAVGYVIIQASRNKFLSPVLRTIKESQQGIKAYRNPKRRTRRRRRLRR